MLRTRQAWMQTNKPKMLAGWFLFVVCILGLAAFLTAFLRLNPDPNFWFVAPLPVTAGAFNVQHLQHGSMGGYRILQFESHQTPEHIQQFYRTELPRHGWYLLCSPTGLEEPNCPLGLSSMADLADAYKRDNEPSKVRAINVTIYKPGANQAGTTDRLVEVIEYRYALPAP
jgi:hypothetical protein